MKIIILLFINIFFITNLHASNNIYNSKFFDIKINSKNLSSDKTLEIDKVKIKSLFRILEFILDNNIITKKYISNVSKGFLFLKKKLKDLKINYYGGVNSNFIFIDFQNKTLANKIFNKLKQNSTAVRYGYPKPFDKGILLTGCPLKEMKIFFSIFFGVECY